VGGDRWESGKRNNGYKRVPDASFQEVVPHVSFQEVEWHKHNFVSLKVPDVS
jgi:hypothetical protein